MKKKMIALIAVVAIVLIIAGAFAVNFNIPVNDQNSGLPPGEPPLWQITLTGSLIEARTVTLKELTHMHLTNVTAAINGENATYVGVPFYDFCNATGLEWDVGPIDVVSADGAKATLNIFQAYNSSAYPYYYTNNVITLVFVKNGQWMTNETGGPVKLIAPYFAPEYQVENVAEINFKPWVITVSGDVSNPLTITRENLGDFPQTRVYAEFAPSVKRWSNWTGLPILDVLQIANMSRRAEKVTIIAVDGYVKNYTLQQVEEGEMLIGYAENDCPLSHSDGGPYRLFAPTDQYKWAQFWVKFVVNITVS